jgi:hypothetical protein
MWYKNASLCHRHQTLSSFVFGGVIILPILSKILMIKVYQHMSFAVRFPDALRIVIARPHPQLIFLIWSAVFVMLEMPIPI